MIEHELVMAVAAPLLVLARPLPVFLWAFPALGRRRVGRFVHRAGRSLGWRTLTEPMVATVLHGLAIWGWHAPGLFQAALKVEGVHWLQHFTFLATALLFWWSLLHRQPRQRGAAIGHLFATSLHTGLLGVLLLVSPRLWFPSQALGAVAWRLTPMEDQQLAGLIMWVPAGLVYAGAAIAFAGLWIMESGRLQAAGGGHAIGTL